MRDGVSDALPHQSGDAVNERMERSKTFFNDEYFPKERRDQFIFRGKKVFGFVFLIFVMELISLVGFVRMSESR